MNRTWLRVLNLESVLGGRSRALGYVLSLHIPLHMHRFIDQSKVHFDTDFHIFHIFHISTSPYR